MKHLISVLSLMICFVITISTANAADRNSQSGSRSYGDAWYDLEKRYPSPERRYSRKDLDQARRRANNSLWMDSYGRKDPIYRSEQYNGRSSGYSQPYRSNRYSGVRNYGF